MEESTKNATLADISEHEAIFDHWTLHIEGHYSGFLTFDVLLR